MTPPELNERQRAVVRALLDHREGRSISELVEDTDVRTTFSPQGKLADASLRKSVTRAVTSLAASGDVRNANPPQRHRPYAEKWCATSKGRTRVEGLRYALAFAVLTADEHLLPALPPSVRRTLHDARQQIEQSAPDDIVLKNRIIFAERGPAYLSVTVRDEVMDVVCKALYRSSLQRIEIEYHDLREKARRRIRVDPQRLVIRKQVAYLVAVVKEDSTSHLESGALYHFPLHQVMQARAIGLAAVEAKPSALTTYLKVSFGIRAPGRDEMIELRFVVDQKAGGYLLERRLSKNQKVTANANGDLEISARVANNEELRWWLLGFGDKLEVILPRQLRNDIAGRLRSAADRYA